MAQNKQHATWKINAVRLNEQEAMLTFHVTLDSGWHLYAQHVRPREAAMLFVFTESNRFALVENVLEESKAIFRFDPFFRQSINRFERFAFFSQRIRVSEGNALVSGEVRFTLGCDGLEPVKEKLQFSVGVTVKTKDKVAAN